MTDDLTKDEQAYEAGYDVGWDKGYNEGFTNSASMRRQGIACLVLSVVCFVADCIGKPFITHWFNQ